MSKQCEYCDKEVFSVNGRQRGKICGDKKCADKRRSEYSRTAYEKRVIDRVAAIGTPKQGHRLPPLCNNPRDMRVSRLLRACCVCSEPIPPRHRIVCGAVCRDIHNHVDQMIKQRYAHTNDGTGATAYQQMLAWFKELRLMPPEARLKVVFPNEYVRVQPRILNAIDTIFGTQLLYGRGAWDAPAGMLSPLPDPIPQTQSGPPPAAIPFLDAEMFIPPDDAMAPDPELPDIDLEEDSPPEESAIELSRRYFASPGETKK